MANRYEFKIEDINSVEIVTKSDQYTNKYIRIYDGEHQTRMFRLTYSSNFEIEISNGKTLAKVMCPRCERWNTFLMTDYLDANFVYECNYCGDDYEETIDEDTLIETINSMITEDTFFDIELRINDMLII